MMKHTVLKKIGCIIAAASVCCSTIVFADDTAAIISTYSAKMGTEQGANNFYYCTFDDDNNPTLMEYSTSGAEWGGNGLRIKSDVISLGNGNESRDIGLMFKAPIKGAILLEGKVFGPYESSGNGNGVNARIVKNNKVIWEKHVTYSSPAEYSVSSSVRAGDEIKFILDKNGDGGYDSFQWWPSVSYVIGDYVVDDTYSYWENVDGNLTQLSYDNESDRYHGNDGIGFISELDVQTTDKTSFVKRYVVKEDGRYRVSGVLKNMDYRGNGNVIYIRKNDELIWQQLAPNEDSGLIDIRMLANVGDTIDVEIKKNEYAGFNYAELSIQVAKIGGTVPKAKQSTSVGRKWVSVSEYPISSIPGAVYSLSFAGNKVPMEYNSSRWTNEKDTSAYASASEVKPGAGGDVVIDVRAPETGTVNFSGNINPPDTSDGILAKIFVNDRLIWSNRVGGEKSAKWDEPYDVKYFNNEVDATVKVNADDLISFTFNRWRLDSNDIASISDLKMTYLTGNPISVTTEWKLNNSIILDTESKAIRNSDVLTSADFFVKDDITYINEEDAKNLFGDAATNMPSFMFDGKNYMPLRATAEFCGKSVAWAAEKYILVFEGLPTMFGFSELSEIETAEKEGVLFE